MFELLHKKIGNYSLLEGVSVALLLGVAFWISSELYQVRKTERVVDNNKEQTSAEHIIGTFAGE